MNILHHLINMYMQWEEKTGIRLWKPGTKESKISGNKRKFPLQKKRGKKILSPRCLDINSKSASLFLAFPVLPGEKSQVWLSEIEEPGWWIHCDRSTTNWSKAASSPPNYLPALSDVPWKISHMHPDAAFTFKQSWFILSVIWKTSNIFFSLSLSLFFCFFYLKNPLGEVDFMVSIIMHL